MTLTLTWLVTRDWWHFSRSHYLTCDARVAEACDAHVAEAFDAHTTEACDAHMTGLWRSHDWGLWRSRDWGLWRSHDWGLWRSHDFMRLATLTLLRLVTFVWLVTLLRNQSANELLFVYIQLPFYIQYYFQLSFFSIGITFHCYNSVGVINSSVYCSYTGRHAMLSFFQILFVLFVPLENKDFTHCLCTQLVYWTRFEFFSHFLCV